MKLRQKERGREEGQRGTENEVVLRELPVADLLLQRLTGIEFEVALETGIENAILDVGSEGVELRTDGENAGLSRREPEGPLSSVVLDEDADHPLEAAQNRPVDDNGPLLPGLAGLRVRLACNT